VLRELHTGGFAGPVYPIHPSAESFDEIPAYASLDQLPTVPDLLAISRPAETVPALATEAAQRGTKALVILSAGFGELATEQGLALDRKLRAVAEEYGVAICGPNSLGLVNVHSGAYISNFAPFEQRPADKGGLALVSHSGALAGSIIALALDRGVGLSYVISSGNELSVSTANYIRYLTRDDKVTALALYLEGAHDGRALIEAVAEATAAGKPVIALKVGDSPSGARAALSHTAKIAGEQNLYRAALEQAGATVARSLDDLVHLPMYLENIAPEEALIPPRRAAIISLSGGLGGVVADEFSRAGLEVPELMAETRRALDELHLPLGGTTNPVDTAGALQRGADAFGDIAAIVASDPGIDVVTLVFPSRYVETARQSPDVVCAIRARLSKPLVVIWVAGSENAAAIADLRSRGVACFESPTACATALTAAAAHVTHQQQEHRLITAPALTTDATGWLSEPATKALLGGFDIDIAREGLATSADEAVKLAGEFGYPVALKVASPDIVHKAAAGGVQLGIGDAEELRLAFARMLDMLGRTSPQANIDGLLVSEMVGIQSEYIIGSYVDDTFGPVLAFGKGGSRVEQESKPQLRLLPMTTADCATVVDQALAELGESPGETTVAGLRAAVDGVARFVAAAGDCLLELDVNPIVVSTAGRVLALDAVAHFKESV
jgi:acetyltransferase